MKINRLFLLTALASGLTPSYALYIGFTQAPYQEYLQKINTGRNFKSTNLYELDGDDDLEAWVNQAEKILEQKLDGNFKSRLVLSISKSGYLDNIDILEIKDNDIEAFQKICANLMDIRLPALSNINNEAIKYIDVLKIVLDTNLKYIERPGVNYLDNEDAFKINQINSNNQELVSELKNKKTLEVKILSPNNIGYGRLGEIIELETINEKAILKANIIEVNRKNLIINVFEINKQSKVLAVNLTYQIDNTTYNQNFTAELVNSSLNTALQGGILNGISSYGIVPASLAIIGLSGKALQLTENHIPINLNMGDTITIKRTKQ